MPTFHAIKLAEIARRELRANQLKLRQAHKPTDETGIHQLLRSNGKKDYDGRPEYKND